MRTGLMLAAVLVGAGALLGGCKGDTYHGPTAIWVSSEPTGASVSLDGKECGRTPLSVEVQPAHNHTILLKYPGHHTVRASISRAYNDWDYPGGGTAFTLYAAGSSAECAPLTAVLLSALIGADIVYAVPYLLRSAQAEPLPPGIHALLPLVGPDEKERVIDWKDEGRGARLAALTKKTGMAGPQAVPVAARPEALRPAATGPAAEDPPPARAEAPLPVYHPRVTP